jgi:hypothetical protein
MAGKLAANLKAVSEDSDGKLAACLLAVREDMDGKLAANLTSVREEIDGKLAVNLTSVRGEMDGKLAANLTSVREDMDMLNGKLAADFTSVREDLRGKWTADLTSLRAYSDGNMVSNNEELRKQISREVEVVSAKLSDMDSLTSKIEDIRLRTEVFAAKIPDSDALGLQIDVLRGRVEVIATNSVGMEPFNTAIQKLSNQHSELQFQCASLRAKCAGESPHTPEDTGRPSSLDSTIIVDSTSVEKLQHSCAHLQNQVAQLTASQEEYDGLKSTILELQRSVMAVQEQATSLKGESTAVDTACRQVFDMQEALLRVQARVEDSANDMSSLRRNVGELQARMENSKTPGKVSSGLMSIFSSRSTEAETGSTETGGHNHEALHSEFSRLKLQVEEQHREVDAAVKEVQEQMVSIRAQSDVLREQMMETLRGEGADADSSAVVDRLDQLQANFELLHGDHTTTMSVVGRVETLEHTVMEATSACQQVVNCLPSDGQFCSVSYLEQKLHNVRDETQESITILGETLTQELAKTMMSKVSSHTASQEELSAWKEKLDRHENRLHIMEKTAQNVDLEGLVKNGTLEEGAREALKQLMTRIDLLESSSNTQFSEVDRTGMMVRSEIDVIRSLQKLTATNLENVQERVQTLEVASAEEAQSDNPGARFEDFRSLAMTLDTLAAGFVDVKTDVDNHTHRIDEMSEDLARTGQLQQEGLEAVTHGIKDYIMNLIVSADKEVDTPRLVQDMNTPKVPAVVLSGRISKPMAGVSSPMKPHNVERLGSSRFSAAEPMRNGGSGLYQANNHIPQDPISGSGGSGLQTASSFVPAQTGKPAAVPAQSAGIVGRVSPNIGGVRLSSAAPIAANLFN